MLLAESQTVACGKPKSEVPIPKIGVRSWAVHVPPAHFVLSNTSKESIFDSAKVAGPVPQGFVVVVVC